MEGIRAHRAYAQVGSKNLCDEMTSLVLLACLVASNYQTSHPIISTLQKGYGLLLLSFRVPPHDGFSFRNVKLG